MTCLTSGSSGITILSLLFLFHLSVDKSSGQHLITPKLTSVHGFSQTNNAHQRNPAPDQLKILGVMVEFLPDTNRFTSGDGTFGPGSIPYLENPGTNIDALPHNKNYFEAHLEFSKNYFETVSGDKISIEFEMLPEVFRLNKPMAAYSPTGENPDLSILAGFVADVWTLIGESANIPGDFRETDNIAFVIFHAGVGRDVELTGTNLDKTPQDLPSLYLSRNSIAEFLGDPAFSGFTIDNGNILVDHSLIVPRTLTRAGDDAAGNRFILPLSINGLLTAQIGSRLGLPDLFNTKTGQSGIGRFGLMDGAGIFSYNGLFPPELSAWEKSFLGWSQPYTINPDTASRVSLPAAYFHEKRSIAKIPVSNSEYFLIENRHRDPEGDGISLTIKKSDGSYIEQTFSNQDIEFIDQESTFYNLLEPGVIVDVSNYDFSLPGGFMSGSDPGTNGGILIWHIDEGIIEEKIHQGGGINDNPDRRGVDLEEADGAQDIGRPTSIGFSQNEVNGSPFDFWWSGNSSRVITQSDTIQLYSNRFAPDTTPDNATNSGAPSHFELSDFSENLPIADFRIRPVNPNSQLYGLWDSKTNLKVTTSSIHEDDYWERYPLALQKISVNQQDWIIVPGYDGIQFYHPENKTLTSPLLTIPSLQQPHIFSDESGFFAVAEHPSESPSPFQVKIYQFDSTEIQEQSAFSVSSNNAFISSFENGILDIDGTNKRIDLKNEKVIQNQNPVQYSDAVGDHQAKIENRSLILNFPGGSEIFFHNQDSENERFYTGLIHTSGNEIFFYLLEDGELSVFTTSDQYQSKRTLYQSDLIGWPAFADFNSDGSPDFLFVDSSANQLIAKNINGAFLTSFPVIPPSNVQFVGTPLIADINGDDLNEIIISGYDEYSMNLYAYNENGEPVDGFPLYVGGVRNKGSQPVHPLIYDDKLIAVSHSGDLKVWKFTSPSQVQWQSKYGNQTNNKISGFIDTGGGSEPQLSLLNSEETYNWPNPAKNETLLRYQTREPADIHIKIMTMSGRVIANHTIRSKGGGAEEVLIDTSEWASGGYLALVEAKSGGSTERKLVKIAIAR